MKNRKFFVFLISVIAICILSFFNKGGSEAIVTLALGLFVANVTQKNEHFNTNNRKGEITNE